jgi:Kef-type K+ transport system membrane component KefB
MSIGTMDTVLTHTISLLGAAVIVAIIARRMRLPYTVGLVRAGLAVAGLETLIIAPDAPAGHRHGVRCLTK